MFASFANREAASETVRGVLATRLKPGLGFRAKKLGHHDPHSCPEDVENVFDIISTGVLRGFFQCFFFFCRVLLAFNRGRVSPFARLL